VRLTIGMAACHNRAEVWFTLQALRLYQDLRGTELVVVDNGGDLAGVVGKCGARYERFTAVQGSAPPKDHLFRVARGEWVICIDSHVMLAPGAVAAFKRWATQNAERRDLLHGPMLYDDLVTTADAMSDEWRGEMWGTWRHRSVPPDAPSYEIPMHGMGLFACRRDAWLGFNPGFRGFGGEEGYIHEKYRKAGQRVMLLPFLRWAHLFRDNAHVPGAPAPYPVRREDKIHNYAVGLAELGLDPARFREHFKLPREGGSE
jgi:hypothetical protein